MSILNRNQKEYKILVIGGIELIEVPEDYNHIHELKNKEIGDEVWERDSAKKDLYNGTFLNFKEIIQEEDKVIVKGCFLDYKYFYAQNQRRDVDFNISLVGVSGIILFKESGVEHVIFAQRSDDVTEYAGMLELIPSGSIDKGSANAEGKIDFKTRLLDELTEETGLDKSCVNTIEGFTVIYDAKHLVYDVCSLITIDTSKQLILSSSKKVNEYRSIVFVAVNKLEQFVKDKKDSIIPTSLGIIEAFQKYRQI